MAASKVNSEIYERDGIKYSIVVEEEEDAFWGTWTCLTCNSSGESSKACKTVRDAADMAKNNTSFHHGTEHEKSADA